MSTARALLSSMRPRQWPKNLVVLSAVIFAGRFTQPAEVLRSIAGVAVFCLISGAMYLVNDVHDREQDRAHETKRLRPIASGRVSPRLALGVASGLALVSLGASIVLGLRFAGVALAYLALQGAYTFFLKDLVILDVMAIAAGFVLRAQAGIVAISVAFSPWLLACAALLALFLGFAKRRNELSVLKATAVTHRASLEHYTPELIDQLLSIVTASTIMSYSLYTFFSPTSRTHNYLMLTIPFVVYGLFRYLYLVYQRDLGGSPEEILLKDAPLIVDIALWLAASLVAMSL